MLATWNQIVIDNLSSSVAKMQAVCMFVALEFMSVVIGSSQIAWLTNFVVNTPNNSNFQFTKIDWSICLTVFAFLSTLQIFLYVVPLLLLLWDGWRWRREVKLCFFIRYRMRITIQYGSKFNILLNVSTQRENEKVIKFGRQEILLIV